MQGLYVTTPSRTVIVTLQPQKVNHGAFFMPGKGAAIMAKKTNCVINGKEYYRICRKVGKKVNKKGLWVNDYKNFYGSCKSEAEAAYSKYMERKEKGVASNKCLGELVDEWIDNVFKSSDVADSTKRKYIRAYEQYFKPTRPAGMPLDEVAALDLQAAYNESPAPYGALRSVHNLLRRFYKYAALNQGVTDITSCLAVPRSAGNAPAGDFKEIDVWEDKDLKKVIDSLKGTTLRFLVVLAANTGARFSELLALTYGDIRDNSLYISKQLSETAPLDGENGKTGITQTKTPSSNRVVPLSAAVLRELEAHKSVHEAEMLKNGYRTQNIFTTSNGTYYYKRNVIRSLKRLYKRIGVPYHKFHSFRHTFGTNLSRAGVPIEEAAALMGHTDIHITAKYYINIDAQRKREAVEKIAAYSL